MSKVYFYVFKTHFVKAFTYKFQVYGSVLLQTIIMLANAFFWKALFKNTETIQGVNVDTMLTYTVMSALITVILTTNVERRIEESVRKGTVAIDFLRPVDIYKVYFAENIASVTALVLQNLVPVFVIGSLFVRLPVPSSGVNFLLFCGSLVLAFGINWLLALLFGMWSFWILNIDAILQVKKHIIRLLSGSLIPVWFFPAWLSKLLTAMPFVYLYQLPLDIFIGKADREEILRGFFIQALWFFCLYALFLLLRRKVNKKIVVQGG